MYYLIYGFLYIISLLPFFALYAISDFISFLLFKVFKYRLKVVLVNLNIAFPNKTEKEKLKIAREFYRNLTDTFIETIKLLSISEKALAKRISSDFNVSEALLKSGKNLQFVSGHQMNWEYGHYAFAKQFREKWIGVYMKINNKSIDRIFLKIRQTCDCILVSAQDFKTHAKTIYPPSYALALVADQNPGWPGKSYWLNFFGKPAPFISGPEKGARLKNPAVVFVTFIKEKRGYYRFSETLITENGRDLKNGQLTIIYRNLLEKAIQEQPSNYLWSHKRWKWTYEDSLKSKWIDDTPPPDSMQPVEYS